MYDQEFESVIFFGIVAVATLCSFCDSGSHITSQCTKDRCQNLHINDPSPINHAHKFNATYKTPWIYKINGNDRSFPLLQSTLPYLPKIAVGQCFAFVQMTPQIKVK